MNQRNEQGGNSCTFETGQGGLASFLVVYLFIFIAGELSPGGRWVLATFVWCVVRCVTQPIPWAGAAAGTAFAPGYLDLREMIKIRAVAAVFHVVTTASIHLPFSPLL